MHELDHLLWQEKDLRKGEVRFAELTGVTPAYGGPHAEGGTHNSLLSLGRGHHLELIAPNPERPEHLNSEHPGTGGLLENVPPDAAPGLFTFAVKAADLNLVGQLAQRSGLEVLRQHGGRTTPSGETLTWETATLKSHDFGGYVPFFIRWGEVVHPSETAPAGCELLEFGVSHPRHQKLAELYAALQVAGTVFETEQPRLRAVLQTPKGRVVLESRVDAQDH